MAAFTVSEATFVAAVSCGMGTLTTVTFDDMPADIMEKLMQFYMPMMPYGTAKARTGDPYEFIATELEKLGHDEIIALLSA